MRYAIIALGFFVSVAAVVWFSTAEAEEPLPEKVDFNKHIRPILSNNCFQCHGPDKTQRKAKLRLDLKKGAFADLGGYHALVPGDVKKSELFQRITSTKKAGRMPPTKSKKTLTSREIALVKRWIEQGADWQDHWAFVTPVRPALPMVKNKAWGNNAIDRFILAQMEKEGLSPSPEADRRTLIRRVTLDLTGLPPTPAEIDVFLKESEAKPQAAYERLVDRLLSSKHYGEHMARFWLDAARYGDTHGLHLDNYREMWPYRDWVIGAFNKNLPYDQFIIQQLAGDLLPNRTMDQLVATGFNRAHVTTNEGGSIREEVYFRNVVDRVETFGTVFLGLTVGCAVCHEHKYDPITQEEFYQLFAFFNSLDGNPLDGNKAQHPPIARVPSMEQKEKKDALDAEIAKVRKLIGEKLASIKYVEPKNPKTPKLPDPQEVVWFDDDLPAGANPQGNTPWQWVAKPKPVFSGKKASTRKATGLSQHFFTGAKQTLKITKGDRLFAYVWIDPKNPPKSIMLQFNDGKWEHRAYWGANRINFGKDKTPSRRPMGKLPPAGKWVRLDVDVAHVDLRPGAQLNGWAFTQFDGTVYWDQAGIVRLPDPSQLQFDSLAQWQKFQRKLKSSSLPTPVQAIVKTDEAERSAEQKKQLSDYFIEHVHFAGRKTFQPLHRKIDQLEKQRAGLEKSFGTTLVWKETAKPRDAFLLVRGQYNVKGKKVERATPEALPPMAKDWPKDRLGLAKWLLSAENPLTARVAVNRFWQQYFGTGLVKTSEDFGNQGERPTHPELLDWLAVEFRSQRSGVRRSQGSGATGRRKSPPTAVGGSENREGASGAWDVRQLQKLIVMSATYRQSSRVTAKHLQVDPQNRLLARGPRIRLDAEVLRDQALALSGLLVRKIGGPSVKPPQPLGLWFAVGYSGSNTVRFKKDTGPDRIYRRSMYTFWKRTSPPPQMDILDAPSREACRMRRERTNTPMQALMLMNDPQYVEAARHLGQRIMKQGGKTAEERVRFAFHLVTARQPTDLEAKVIHDTHQDFLKEYRADTKAAQQLIRVGESAPDAALNAPELASWTMVANLVLNLDEVINKN